MNLSFEDRNIVTYKTIFKASGMLSLQSRKQIYLNSSISLLKKNKNAVISISKTFFRVF